MSQHSDRNRGLFWGLIIIIIGFLFLFAKFGWINTGDLWPLAIIAIGG